MRRLPKAGCDDDPAWVGQLLADRWKMAPSGTVAIWLAFDDPGAAAGAAADLRRKGFEVQVQGTVVVGGLKPVRAESSAPP